MAILMWWVERTRKFFLGYGGAQRKLNPANRRVSRLEYELAALQRNILRQVVAPLLHERSLEMVSPALVKFASPKQSEEQSLPPRAAVSMIREARRASSALVPGWDFSS